MRVRVSHDAASIAVGGLAVAQALREAEAQVLRVGSRGLFWLEPLIEIETPIGWQAFGPVAAAEVPSILDSVRNSARHALALGNIEEHPFLMQQTRLTFARCGSIDPVSVEDYAKTGGLEGLKRAIEIGPEKIREEIAASGLRGRGGAGFPAAIKWNSAALTAGAQKYVVCNADEGDSGTYADRMLMEGDPFLLIEGMVIAGIAIGATKGYVYIRSEYPHAIAAMRRAVDVGRENGLLGKAVLGSAYAFDLEIRMGAGSYVCGEETALLDSLEGKRGQVRAKPPLPVHVGLFGKPTIINNVLTFAAAPTILAKGGAFYQSFGLGRSRGTMPIQLAGDIKYGGLFETAFGPTLGKLVNDIGGGTRSGRP
ncbi:MAG: formate dehydrogenase, partial [Alphaproteobacteria bacterium]|nr:formate dehydrogenase [Alphaproteobacteria bacterium]